LAAAPAPAPVPVVAPAQKSINSLAEHSIAEKVDQVMGNSEDTKISVQPSKDNNQAIQLDERRVNKHLEEERRAAGQKAPSDVA